MLCPWETHFTLECFTLPRCKWVNSRKEIEICTINVYHRNCCRAVCSPGTLNATQMNRSHVQQINVKSAAEAHNLSGRGSQPQRQRLTTSAAEAHNLSGRGSQPQRQRLTTSAAEAHNLSGRGSQPQRQRLTTSAAEAHNLSGRGSQSRYQTVTMVTASFTFYLHLHVITVIMFHCSQDITAICDQSNRKVRPGVIVVIGVTSFKL